MNELNTVTATLVGPEIEILVPHELFEHFIMESGGQLMTSPPPKFFGCKDGFLGLFGIRVSPEMSCVYSLIIPSQDLEEVEELAGLFEAWSSYEWVGTLEEVGRILEKHISLSLN
jgi:hypothetical protein